MNGTGIGRVSYGETYLPVDNVGCSAGHLHSETIGSEVGVLPEEGGGNGDEEDPDSEVDFRPRVLRVIEREDETAQEKSEHHPTQHQHGLDLEFR